MMGKKLISTVLMTFVLCSSWICGTVFTTAETDRMGEAKLTEEQSEIFECSEIYAEVLSFAENEYERAEIERGIQCYVETGELDILQDVLGDTEEERVVLMSLTSSEDKLALTSAFAHHYGMSDNTTSKIESAARDLFIYVLFPDNEKDAKRHFLWNYNCVKLKGVSENDMRKYTANYEWVDYIFEDLKIGATNLSSEILQAKESKERELASSCNAFFYFFGSFNDMGKRETVKDWINNKAGRVYAQGSYASSDKAFDAAKKAADVIIDPNGIPGSIVHELWEKDYWYTGQQASVRCIPWRYCSVNDSEHTMICSICNIEKPNSISSHKLSFYRNNGDFHDMNCSICGGIVSHKPIYVNGESIDDQTHWATCSICGKNEITPHEIVFLYGHYGCNVCGIYW